MDFSNSSNNSKSTKDSSRNAVTSLTAPSTPALSVSSNAELVQEFGCRAICYLSCLVENVRSLGQAGACQTVVTALFTHMNCEAVGKSSLCLENCSRILNIFVLILCCVSSFVTESETSSSSGTSVSY